MDEDRGSGRAALAVVMVEEIPRPPGGKTEVFTSDFVPARTDEGA